MTFAMTNTISNTTIRGLLLGACIAVSGCDLATMARLTYDNASAEHHWHSDAQSTTVPFTLVDNHIIVPVSVNGSEPLKFVLDSGAGASVLIDSRQSRALELEPSATITVSGVGTGPHPTAGVLRGLSLDVGDLEVEGMSLIHLPLEAIPFFEDLDDVYFDGVIGAPFFKRFSMAVDYERKELSFIESSDQPALTQANGWSSIPLEIQSGVPYVNATVSNADGSSAGVRVLVDTGARHTASLTPSTHPDIKVPASAYTQTSQGISGEVVSRVGIAPALTLAGHDLGPLPVNYDIEGGETEANSNGIVGNEILRRFNLMFDYSNKTLYLKPNSDFDAPMYADRSGLEVRPHAEGIIVRQTTADSAANTIGLSTGDIITSFDGVVASTATVSVLKKTLASPAESILVCWRSEVASHQCGDMPLVDRI